MYGITNSGCSPVFCFILGRVVLTTNIQRVALFELLFEQAFRALVILPLLHLASRIVPFDGIVPIEDQALIMGIEAGLTIIAAYSIAALVTPMVSFWCLNQRHQFLREEIREAKRILAHDLWRMRSGVVVWVTVSTATVLFFSTGSILLGSVLLLATVVLDQAVTIRGMRTVLLP